MAGTALPITDADELAAVRRQAVRVRRLIVATAALLTALYVLLSTPGLLR
ncbi:MAG TPA: hypothetical protein VMN60_05890 [Longimicrobiales bacterium]|nr:hypothetical protein [Longimicrobiales bacterium]